MRIKAYVDASVPARAEVFLGARMQRRKSANLYGTSVEQDASACANGRSATAEKPRAAPWPKVSKILRADGNFSTIARQYETLAVRAVVAGAIRLKA